MAQQQRKDGGTKTHRHREMKEYKKMITKEASNKIVNTMDDVYKLMLKALQSRLNDSLADDCIDPDEPVVNFNLCDAIRHIKNAINSFELFCIEEID
jgi:hypothetical protein